MVNGGFARGPVVVVGVVEEEPFQICIKTFSVESEVGEEYPGVVQVMIIGKRKVTRMGLILTPVRKQTVTRDNTKRVLDVGVLGQKV